ncbi:amidohydrolase [Acinetobacter sp. CAAS 2-6]|uniref:amidohydrolase n=1 Tax=Acinetobacter sp. CAAS 2-6 TaxID=3016358 RepID=UPI002DD67DA7|nr:amidohydrolase [Acinetobacter sp. CAAS 2-6]
MKKHIGLMLTMVAASPLAMADWVDNAVQNTEKDTIQLYQRIHQNPELGNMEFKTSQLVQQELQSYGIEVKTGFAKTGVIGILKGTKPGPVMALRADMDALPMEEKSGLPFASKVRAIYQGSETAVAHACGHDAHTAMLLSAAKVLAKNRDKINGTVVFIFQPAEEGGADIDNFKQGDQVGSRKLIADGALKNPKPEVIFGLHVMAGMPSGHLYYKSGAALNSADSIRITLNGQQVHGSMPWNGRDAIVAAAQIINNMQTMVSRRADLSKGMGVVSIGQIQAGTSGNIIPEKVSMIGTLRSNHEDIRNSMQKHLPHMIESTADANEVKAQVEISPYAPVTMNDKTLTELIAPALQKAAGSGKAHVLEKNLSPSEDFAYYGKLMPSLFVFLGATPEQQDMSTAAPNHNPKFVVDQNALKTGVKSHVQFVLDYPNIASKVQQAWKPN